MSLLRAFKRTPDPAVRLCDSAEELSAILAPDCAAALWRRQMPRDVLNWLATLDPERLPRGRVILPPAALARTLTHLCDMAEMPEGPERAWLEADITALAMQFAEMMEARFLRLRLDVVTTNACRKFHVDAITARLICTYRGTGTQYGRSEFGNDPKRVYTTPTGAPILLRGTLWPEAPFSGLLHRSPPIEGTDETRLLLVLDPVADPDGDF